MRAFDTHCHLGLDDRGDPREEHARAIANGVTDFVLVGIDLATSAAARDLARTLPGARWSAGLHPNDAKQFDAEWPGIAELAREPDCVALGETGLDFFRDHATREEQERSLHAHMELAREQSLPLIFHCRDAMDALLTLSSKGQLVIPARLRQLLGLQPGDRLALSLEADGLRLVPEDREKSRSARALIGTTAY
jgi:TatD DNase family protein